MSRFVSTWDVDIVLKKLKTSPVKFINLRLLSMKLALLLCLVLAGRTQSLHLLTITGMIKGTNSYSLHYSDN